MTDDPRQQSFVRDLCPRCDDPLTAHGVCESCGYGKKATAKQQRDEEQAQRNDAIMAKTRELSAHRGLYDNALTDQQWYNVCKFYPFIARKCGRALFTVGPDHPLDATSRQGPLFRRLRFGDVEAESERAAIQGE